MCSLVDQPSAAFPIPPPSDAAHERRCWSLVGADLAADLDAHTARRSFGVSLGGVDGSIYSGAVHAAIASLPIDSPVSVGACRVAVCSDWPQLISTKESEFLQRPGDLCTFVTPPRSAVCDVLRFDACARSKAEPPRAERTVVDRTLHMLPPPMIGVDESDAVPADRCEHELSRKRWCTRATLSRTAPCCAEIFHH